MKKRFLGLFLLFLLVLSACGGPKAPVAEPEPPAPTPPEKSAVMAEFTAEDLEGNTLDQSILSDFDVTCVNIWATFCGPCKREMPVLAALHTEYADKGLQILGLVSDTIAYGGEVDTEQIDVAKTLLADAGGTYRNLVPSQSLMEPIALNIPLEVVPTTFFVNSAGEQVGAVYEGAKNKEEWAAIFDALLAEVAEK